MHDIASELLYTRVATATADASRYVDRTTVVRTATVALLLRLYDTRHPPIALYR